MFKPTKLTIFNSNSELIYDGEISTPIIGLNAGDNFWWKQNGKQQGAKVVGIRYGFDLDNQQFNVEIVCDKDDVKFHSQFKKTEVISHGIKKIDRKEVFGK